jgi:hypothetical protein
MSNLTAGADRAGRRRKRFCAEVRTFENDLPVGRASSPQGENGK